MAGTDSNRRRFGSVRKLPSGRCQARYTVPAGFKRPASRSFESQRAVAEVMELQVWRATVEMEGGTQVDDEPIGRDRCGISGATTATTAMAEDGTPPSQITRRREWCGRTDSGPAANRNYERT